jgi:hypothetical protein
MRSMGECGRARVTRRGEEDKPEGEVGVWGY